MWRNTEHSLSNLFSFSLLCSSLTMATHYGLARPSRRRRLKGFVHVFCLVLVPVTVIIIILVVGTTGGNFLDGTILRIAGTTGQQSKTKQEINDDTAEQEQPKPKPRAVGHRPHYDNNAKKSISSTVPIDKDDVKGLCLQPECIQQQASRLARAFPRRSNNKTWLVVPSRAFEEDRQPNNNNNKKKKNKAQQQQLHTGIIFVKVPKTASSTVAGVALRLSHLYGNTTVKWQHALASEQQYGHRDKAQSLLFASVRDPTTRILSSLNFRAATKERPLTERGILQALQQQSEELPQSYVTVLGRGGLQLVYMALDDIPKYSIWDPKYPTTVQHPETVHDIVQKIIQQYDFLVVTERLDESLVALSLLLGIPMSDVLVTPSKVAKGEEWYLVPGRLSSSSASPKCVKLSERPPMTVSIQQYIESDEWYAKNYGDILLHTAANQSLEWTIQQLGPNRFDLALKEYQRLKLKVKHTCHHRIQFPCSLNGQPQLNVSERYCYVEDIGCGHACIDEMIYNETK